MVTYAQHSVLGETVLGESSWRLQLLHAHILRSLAEYGQAASTYTELIADSSPLTEANHDGYLALADRYNNIGQPDTAVALLEEVRPLAAETLGEQLAADAFQRHTQLLGSDHANTLIFRSSFAVIKYRLGRYEESVMLLREVIEQQQESLSPMHLRTLLSRSHPGMVLFESGQVEAGKQTWLAVRADMVEAFGANSTHVQYTYNSTYMCLEVDIMGQVTIYLEDELEAKMAADAKARKLSKSKWVAAVIREKLVNEWPVSVVEPAGNWDDFPPVEEIRGEPTEDIAREKL